MKFGIAVVHEEVAAHRLGEPRRGQVILNVGEPDARRDSGRPGARREQRRLADAEALSGLEHCRGAEHFGIGEVEEGVVADFVAHRVVEGNSAFAIGFPCRILF